MPRLSSLLLLAVWACAASYGQQPSHRPLGGVIDGSDNPEDLVQERLMRLRFKNEEEKKLGKDIEGLARKLLADPKTLESLKSLKGLITPEQLEAMKKKLASPGQGLQDLPQLRELLQRPEVLGKLTGRQRELIERWSKAQQEEGTPGPGPGVTSPPPPPVPVDRSRPVPSASSLPEWLQQRVERWAGNAKDWLKSSDMQALREFAERLLHSKDESSAVLKGLAQEASGLSRFLPRLSDYLPRGLSGQMSQIDLRPPSLGALGASRFGWSLGWQALAVAGALGLLLLAWVAMRWHRAHRARRARQWRPGPWPVLPSMVQDREQVVRAFEHLAFVLLGREARTMSHGQVARKIGKPEAMGLATVYEKARYAPPGDELTSEEVAQARRWLCGLAGAA
jgi:hypothetical protein